MKKFAFRVLSLALVLALALSLAACGGASSQPAASQDSSAQGTGDAQPTMDYSAAFDQNGYWDGITALDYVTLPQDYAAPVLTADIYTPDPASVETTVNALPYNFPISTTTTDRAVEYGDTVNIDYVGSVDGVEFDGGNTMGMGVEVMAGATNYIDDFLTQIIGHMPGETFDVNVTFPDPYNNNPDLSGKDAVFVTTINHIKILSTPELTDEFVAEKLAPYYDGASTVEELTAVVTEDVRRGQIYDYLTSTTGYMTRCTFSEDLPENLISYQSDLCVEYFRSQAVANGLDFATFLSMYFEGVSNAEELVAYQADAIKEAVRQSLMFQAIAESEGIVIDEEAATEYMSKSLGTSDISAYEAQYGMPYIKNYVMTNTVLDMLAENAVEG